MKLMLRSPQNKQIKQKPLNQISKQKPLYQKQKPLKPKQIGMYNNSTFQKQK
jgi:hypothetical protein